MGKLNEKGHEILSTEKPVIPINFKKPLPIAEQVRRMVKRELSNVAERRGKETFEESDDFNVGDDVDIRSKYELDEDQANYKFIPEKPNDDIKKVERRKDKPSEKEGRSNEGDGDDRKKADRRRKRDIKERDANIEKEGIEHEDEDA